MWTYSLAPSWHFDANSMVYARLATGYRPGGPNVLPPNAPPDVQRTYGSDKTTNIELGVRSTQLDGRLSLDVAALPRRLEGHPAVRGRRRFGINANGGTARSQGLEWTFGYLPVQGLTFQWTGAYTDAKLTSDAPAINASNGDPLPYAPEVEHLARRRVRVGRVRRLQGLGRRHLELRGLPQQRFLDLSGLPRRTGGADGAAELQHLECCVSVWTTPATGSRSTART